MLRDRVKTHLERGGLSQTAAFDVSDSMLGWEDLEAEGWARLAISLPKDKVPDARERYLRIRSVMNAQSPWQSPDAELANLINLGDLGHVGFKCIENDCIRTSCQGQIQLNDEARRGMDHLCKLRRRPTSLALDSTERGGGIGVIDFDLDGWLISQSQRSMEAPKSNSSQIACCGI